MTLLSANINNPKPPTSTMALALNTYIDYESIIYENCRVFLGPDVDLKVITELDPSKQWHAHVLVAEDGIRRAVLTATGKNAAHALERLHEKSALSVGQYKAVNGFELPLQFSTRSSHSGGETNRRTKHAEHDSDPLEHSEVIALCGSSSSEASNSASELDSSDDEAKSPLKSRHRRRRRHKSRPTSPILSPRRSNPEIVDPPRPYSFSSPTYPAPPFPIPPPNRKPKLYSAPPVAPLPSRAVPPWNGPGLPPPGWGRIPPPPGFPASNKYPAPSFSAQGRVPPIPKLQAQVPIKITIQWKGRGQQNILVRSFPNRQAITSQALLYLQQRNTDLTLGVAPRILQRLGARLTRVSFADSESCDVHTFGDDFSSLCGDGKGVLGVEVEIHEPSFRGDTDSESDRDIVNAE